MRRIRLAILANEFFAPELGRVGGFGWAAQQVARCFREHESLGLDVVFLAAEVLGNRGQREATVHDTRLLLKQPGRFRNIWMTAAERIDLVLTIDYRPSYHPHLWMLPRTPVIVWARDPRTPSDVRHINTLRIPGQDHVRPQGIQPIDCTSLGTLVRLSKLFRRKVLVASKMPHIAEKLPSTYHVHSSLVLPNPDVLDYDLIEPIKHPQPRVVFLARLDPYKRPWLFVELARRFPRVEFLLLGRSHFQGPGSWEPVDLAPNVRVMGHLNGSQKVRLLASAWVLVNTSIYEESPVSMLEALACETPILSCVDTGDIAPRFGVYIGQFDGTGLDAMPKLEAGLERLLGDSELRSRLGKAGRRWVTEEHNTRRFLEAFDRLCTLAGVSP